MKKTLLVTFAILFSLVSFCHALETDTHEVINEYIARNTFNGFSLDSYLKSHLNIDEGIEESFDSYKVWWWLKIGGKYEDEPPASMPYIRSLKHFHNPLTDQGLKGDNESSIQWSQKPAGTQSPGGHYSWHDVRGYFYNALTSLAGTEREENFAQTFRGLGQLMHLVQDLSVPAHTRDDGNVLYNYEKWVKEKDENGNPNVDISSIAPIYFAHYLIGAPNPLASVPVANLFDTNQYVGSNPGITMLDNIGLSEYTNTNFFSADTIFKNSPYPSRDSVLSDDAAIPDPRYPSGAVLRKYFHKVSDGDTGYRLATVSFLQGFEDECAPFCSEWFFEIASMDGEVYGDYAEKLIPRAVGYSAGLLDYFFRGDMEIKKAFIKRGGGLSISGIAFEVKNTTPPVHAWQTAEPFESGSLDLSYQYIPPDQDEPVFHIVPGIYTITGANDPINSEFVPVNIIFPADKIIPDGASDLSFTLVFHGKLGDEAGAVAGRAFGYSMPSRIAYYYQPGGFGNESNIYTVLPDGSDIRAITTTSSTTPGNSLYFFAPAWSPDGTKLAFEKETCTNLDPTYEGECEYYSRDIVVIDLNLDESYPDNVLTTLHAEKNGVDWTYMPSFSPDGSRIVAMVGDMLVNSLVIFDLNTGNWRYIKEHYQYFVGSAPAWSPNGDKIAYSNEERVLDPETQETIDWSADIYLINPEGVEEIRLTNDDYWDIQPAWSPDGEHIVFASDRDGEGTLDLWIMDKAGGDMQKICDCSHGCTSPSFSPDGERIAFIECNNNIYTIALDGSGLTQVTTSGYFTTSPEWSPFLPEDVTISASPVAIRPGESSTLSWNSTHADSCVIEPGIGDVDTNGSITISPAETTTYTITATGPGWTASASATVTVAYPAPTVTISAAPDTIQPGESSTLSWSSTDADSCVIEPDIGSVGVSGTISVSPTEATMYTITATGSGGTATAGVMVLFYNSAFYITKIPASDMQTGVAGEKLEKSLQVKVLDQDIMPVEHAAVTFFVKAGGGKFANNEACITVKTNADGIASADLTLGEKTSANPIYIRLNPGDEYLTRVGLNIVDAFLSTVASIASPFIAYGYPGAPDRIIKAYGDETTAQPNCPAGTIRAIVADRFENPVSNRLIIFTALPAESKNPYAQLPGGCRNIEFYRQEDCTVNYPLYGDCQTHETISRNTAYFGAMVNTILGNTAGTKYTVEITSGGIPPVYFHLYSEGVISDNVYSPPVLHLNYMKFKGKDGEPVDAAKAGEGLRVPVVARLFMSYPEYRIEGPYLDNFADYNEPSDIRKFWKVWNTGIVHTQAVTDGTVDFVPVQGGGSVTPTENLGNGEYRTTYTTGPEPAVNIIEAQGEAMVTVPEVLIYYRPEHWYRDFLPIIFTPTLLSREVVLKSGEEVIFDWDTKEPIKTGGEKTIYTVYGVDIRTEPRLVVPVNTGGYVEQDVNIEYEILPSEYQATLAYVVISRKAGDDEPIPISYIYTETQGKGYAIIARGFPFDLDPDVSYYAQVVLNNDTDVEIRSEMIELIAFNNFTVDIKTEPRVLVPVNIEGYVEEDFDIEYEILPSEYQAADACVVISRKAGDDAAIPISYISTETQGKGFATIINGFKFDLAPDVSYDAQVVLNKGTDAEIRSKKVPLEFVILRECPVDDECCKINTGEQAGSLVDLTRGEYTDDVVGLFVKAMGHRIEVRRRFFDDTWHFDLSEPLEMVYSVFETRPAYIVSDGVRYKKSNDEGTVYSYASDPRYAANRQIHVNADGYLWKDKSGNWRQYDNSGRPVSYGNSNNVQVTFLYGADERLTGLADNSGNQLLWYEYDQGGKISGVRDASGRRVDYYYDGDKLSKVADPLGNETLYAYDSEGRLITKRDPAGRTISITYNESGYVAGVMYENGSGKLFEYGCDAGLNQSYGQIQFVNGMLKKTWFDPYGNRIKTDINGKTDYSVALVERTKIVEDSNGNKTIKEYDEMRNLISVTYPDGSMVTYEYEQDFNKRSKEIDERGIVTQYQYDQAGNMTRKVEAAGTASERIIEYAYDNYGNQVTIKVLGDANTAEAITTMEYDESGNMTSITDPAGNTTLFTCDIMGNVLTKQDAGGKVWTYGYDAKGQLTSIKDPLQNIRQLYYNATGNKVREVDPEGKQTTYEYNCRNDLVKSTDALGNSTLFEYNMAGKLIKQTDQEGKVTCYQYDLDARLVKTIDGNGNEIAMEYDASGPGCPSCSGGKDQPSKIFYPTFARAYVYDTIGRKTEERDVLSETESYSTQFEYDPTGNLISKTDKEGKTTTYEYDNLKRLIKVIDPLGQATGYTYDNRDNLIELKDANGNTTWFEYGLNNRLTKEIRPMGEETTYSYDGVGNLIQKVDAKNQKTAYAYDSAGRLVEINYFDSGDHVNPVKTVDFAYNNLGSLITYSDGATSAAYVYDDLQRKVSETVDYGAFELAYSYEYYKNGTKKTFTGPDGITYEYAYDPNNQLTAVNIPDTGSITVNAYTWNRPADITLPGGNTKAFAYDPLMRTQSITAEDSGKNIVLDYQYAYDKIDNIVGKDTEHGDYAYGYDDLYQLNTVDNPDFDDEAFSYDPVGNRLTSAWATGDWDYNQNNELESYSDVSYVYDDNGNMTQKTVGGQLTTYFFNIEDRLERVEDGSGNVIAAYSYDPFGRRLWKDVSGTRTYFLYADEGLIGEYDVSGNEIKSYGYRPGSIYTTDPLFMKISSDYYFYYNDHLGTPQKMTAVNGEVVWAAKYSSFGKAEVDSSSTVTNPLRFAGQYEDEETGLQYNYYRYYDPKTGRYLTADPIGQSGGINLFAYGNNNPINSVDPLGLLCNGQITNIEGEWGEWSIKPTAISYDWKFKARPIWDKIQPKAQIGLFIVNVSGEAKASVNCTGCCGSERISWNTNAICTATVSPEFPIKKGLLPFKVAFILKGLIMSDYIGDSYLYKALQKFEKEIQMAIDALGDAATYCKVSAKALEN